METMIKEKKMFNKIIDVEMKNIYMQISYKV